MGVVFIDRQEVDGNMVFSAYEPVTDEDYGHKETKVIDGHLWGRVDTKAPSYKELFRRFGGDSHEYWTWLDSYALETICEGVDEFDLWSWVDKNGTDTGQVIVPLTELPELKVH